MPMFPMIGGLMGLAGGAMQYFGQQQTNDMQMQLAQEQMRFQEQMSNTAYQRSTADMEKAGLNPMMMFGSGAAASTPAGAQAQLSNPAAGATDAVAKSINSAIAMKTADATIDQMALQNAKLISENEQVKAQTGLTGAQTVTEQQKPALVRAETLGTAASTDLKLADLPRATADAKFYDSDIGRFLRKIGLGGEEVGRFFSPLTSIAHSAASLAK